MQVRLHVKETKTELKIMIEKNEEILTEKEKLMKELEGASGHIDKLGNDIYQTNATALELLKTLKDSEAEIEALKGYIIDLKSRISVYIPAKNDNVDRKLAEYINNYPERNKLKIMFMRESEGVY